MDLPPIPAAALPGERYRRARVAGGAVLALGAVAAASWGVYTGLPVLDHPARPEYAVSGGAAALLIGWFAWTSLRVGARRTQIVVGAVATVLLTGFIWGALTSVTINGKVYLFNSPTARAYETAMSMRDDIFTLADADTLIGYDDTQARAHYPDYAKTVKQLNKMAEEYAAKKSDSYNDPQFAVVAKEIADGAHLAAQAADGRRALVTAEDTKQRALVAGWRTGFTEQVTSASTLLAQTAQTYGITFPGESS
jgi:hypothetical protein